MCEKGKHRFIITLPLLILSLVCISGCGASDSSPTESDGKQAISNGFSKIHKCWNLVSFHKKGGEATSKGDVKQYRMDWEGEAKFACDDKAPGAPKKGDRKKLSGHVTFEATAKGWTFIDEQHTME